jgi:hypothetical protein
MGGGGLLGGVSGALFGKPQQAPVPDYASAAEATAQGNLEAARVATAANRVNQVTPYGNLTYKQTGVDSYGNPTWTATTDLSDVGQQLLNADNAVALGLGGTTQAALQNVANTMGRPFNPDLPQLSSGINTPTYNQVGQGPSFQSVKDAETQRQIGEGPQFSRVGNAPQLQTGVSGTGMEGWDAASQLIMNRLQPQMQRQEAQLDAQLANQGIMPNSEAYNNAKMGLAAKQNDLMVQAQLQGQQVQNSLFNQNLNAGQFTNQALLGQNQAQLSNLGFNNQAGQQGYANQLAQQQANNQAMQQNFANQLSAVGFNNQTGQQGYANQLAAQQANNAALAQGVQNQLANAQLGNQANQQAYTQALTNYNLPLNTLSALRSGQQVQNPSFQNVPLQATTAGPDLLGAAGMTGQANIANTNAANAYNASMNQGLMNVGGSLIAMSDIRSKENIKPIGVMNNGLTVYEFEYKPEFKERAGHGKQIGVMAQEVEKVIPHAVITLDDGYKMVNYGLL